MVAVGTLGCSEKDYPTTQPGPMEATLQHNRTLIRQSTGGVMMTGTGYGASLSLFSIEVTVI